jgi:hypothetical protein
MNHSLGKLSVIIYCLGKLSVIIYCLGKLSVIIYCLGKLSVIIYCLVKLSVTIHSICGSASEPHFNSDLNQNLELFLSMREDFARVCFETLLQYSLIDDGEHVVRIFFIYLRF